MQPLTIDDDSSREMPRGSGKMPPRDDTRSRTQKKRGYLELDQGDIDASEHDGSRQNVSVPTTSNLGKCDFRHRFDDRTDFWAQVVKITLCLIVMQATYLISGYLQEALMVSEFTPTKSAPYGKFPSASFSVFCNRFMAFAVAMIVVRTRHLAFFANNTAPMKSFAPMVIGNSISSWSHFASLRYLSSTVQAVGKSTDVMAVMLMGLALYGASYPFTQYVEAFLITIGLIIISTPTFDSEDSTELAGVVFLAVFVMCKSFSSQWQERIFIKYGRPNVDIFQMMLGVESFSICVITVRMVVSGDFPTVLDFITINPKVIGIIIPIAILSTIGQLALYFLFKEVGPVAFTIIMSAKGMIAMLVSSIVFNHPLNGIAYSGVALVVGVVLYQFRRKYLACKYHVEADRENTAWLERISREREESERMVEQAGEMMLEITRRHLDDFVRGNPEATYEQWIGDLHPENVERGTGEIDLRFYVEDSDHRLIWNDSAEDLRDPVEARQIVHKG